MTKKKKTTVIEGEPHQVTVHRAEMIPGELLFEHPNNTNKQSKHVQRELIESIQQHGFDESLLVVPRSDGQPGYWIVAGNHRKRAGVAAGMLEFPCVVRHDWDEVEARIQLVRRNYVRGEIDRALFTEEVNRLSKDEALALDIIMERMGFEDSDAFTDFYKEEKKKERAMAHSVEASAATSQVKMIDDIGIIISTLFERYGSTVPQSFLVFPSGGRNHEYIQITPSTKKALDQINARCKSDGLDINTVLGGILQIGIHHAGFFKPSVPVDEVLEKGSLEGDSNPELLVDEEQG